MLSDKAWQIFLDGLARTSHAEVTVAMQIMARITPQDPEWVEKKENQDA